MRMIRVVIDEFDEDNSTDNYSHELGRRDLLKVVLPTGAAASNYLIEVVTKTLLYRLTEPAREKGESE